MRIVEKPLPERIDELEEQARCLLVEAVEGWKVALRERDALRLVVEELRNEIRDLQFTNGE